MRRCASSDMVSYPNFFKVWCVVFIYLFIYPIIEYSFFFIMEYSFLFILASGLALLVT